MTEYISKSEVKRQFKQTEKVAEELADFTNKDLKKLPCSDELKEEIIATRGLKGGSRKRQIKHLAKVMRQEPLDEIYNYLQERKGSNLKDKKSFHEAERVRDAIISEAIQNQEETMQEHRQWDMDWPAFEITYAVGHYPALEEQEIRKIVYSYVKTRNRLHYRELFRMIKAAIDQEELKKRMS
ncbi:ribosome biogenesis factor YjgA [Desulfosediminicola flagellatus]|uniref:ribosome biogenesis factor YjgA n=1 Tax=Desulfosediminicola flagellatus TaxID=2569541 RepID=UPI0010AB976E|nr:ribosome biogenesis factor YjgA [Desulfosediminicola flagellatus]